MVVVAATMAVAQEYASAANYYVSTRQVVDERQTALDAANTDLVDAKARLTAAAEAAGLSDFSVT
jgi:hypothetical protein